VEGKLGICVFGNLCVTGLVQRQHIRREGRKVPYWPDAVGLMEIVGIKRKKRKVSK
jgi:hypothetical protein